MLRILLECKNARSENIAKHLDRMTEGFKLWSHDDMIYVLFELDSLSTLRELSGKLKRAKNVEFRYVKIQTVRNYDA